MSVHPAYERLRPVTDHAGVVLCKNPGTMTLDGTNTWILRAPGSAHSIVIDPGPNKSRHLKQVAEDAGSVALVLSTHRHPDHTKGVKAFASRVSAPARSYEQQYCVDAPAIADQEILRAAGLELLAVHTPGHTPDSMCFVVRHDGHAVALVSGDTVLGTGTSVIGTSPGAMRSYLHSLELVVEYGSGVPLLPGHGPDQPDAGRVAAMYLAHRRNRIAQLSRFLDQNGMTPATAKPFALVRTIYRGTSRKLWPAAHATIKAQLAYLLEESNGATNVS